ncbi:3-hydroxyacyl-CoA dehydrogenase family protein [Polymorphobacter sp.]|uniref:3-hydroxyacyl-CoA dehydrogenase family protein n=1 Tax=Polymorphobacter sp. TaxID=1909290 RepID=UPI003F6F0EA7
MSLSEIAVIGGGLMGASIAQCFAVAGHRVHVHEPHAPVRETIIDRIRDDLALIGADLSAADRIIPTGDLATAVGNADFVTEAAPERLELKRALFADLAQLAPRHAILGSNSSVIRITAISDGLETAERMVGTHWWNPAALIPLVEVIQGARTSPETVAATMALLASIGKKPAHVRKDVTGFIGNRLQHALWHEAIALIAEGVCDAQTLDDCVKNSFGLRLAVLGPAENMDLIGLDLTRDIHSALMPDLHGSHPHHPWLDTQIAAGKLGFKTGEGLRAWTPEEMATVRKRLVAHLVESLDQTAEG